VAKRKTAAERRAAARKRAALQLQAERKAQARIEPDGDRGPSRREERLAARDAQLEILEARRRLLNRLEAVTVAGALVSGTVWVMQTFVESAYDGSAWLRWTLLGLLFAFVLASMGLGTYVTLQDRAAWYWKALVLIPLTTIPGGFYYAIVGKRELSEFTRGARTPTGRGSRRGSTGGGRGPGGGGRDSGGSSSSRAGGAAGGGRRSQSQSRQSKPTDKVKLLGDR